MVNDIMTFGGIPDGYFSMKSPFQIDKAKSPFFIEEITESKHSSDEVIDAATKIINDIESKIKNDEFESTFNDEYNVFETIVKFDETIFDERISFTFDVISFPDEYDYKKNAGDSLIHGNSSFTPGNFTLSCFFPSICSYVKESVLRRCLEHELMHFYWYKLRGGFLLSPKDAGVYKKARDIMKESHYPVEAREIAEIYYCNKAELSAFAQGLDAMFRYRIEKNASHASLMKIYKGTTMYYMMRKMEKLLRSDCVLWSGILGHTENKFRKILEKYHSICYNIVRMIFIRRLSDNFPDRYINFI